MKFKLALLLAVFSSSTFAGGFTQGDEYAFNGRLQEMLETTGWNFKSAIDVKNVVAERGKNEVNARLIYGEPRIYYGRVDKVYMDHMAAYLIVNAGTSSAVTVVLERIQAAPWRPVGRGLELAGMQSSMQYSSQVELGSTMYFQCGGAEFGLGVYLKNCLAFSNAVAMKGVRPDVREVISIADHVDDLIKARAAEGWARPSSVHPGLSVEMTISINDNSEITSVVVKKASGDRAYDQSVVNALKNIGVLPEMQSMTGAQRLKYRSYSLTLTPADLVL